jgi:hypothetical protein
METDHSHKEHTMHLPSRLTRLLLPIALGSACLTAYADSGASAPAGWAQHQAAREAHMEKQQEGQLARMADILQLTSQQQGSSAWQDYIKAVRSMKPKPWTPMARNSDAAAVMRARADALANHAKQLSALADATQALEKILTEPQKKAFNVLARQQHHRMHHAHGWPEAAQ